MHRLRRGDFLCIQPGTVHSLHNPGPGGFAP
jgi:quercetin dioxygenase-like cupin family protein